MEIKPPTWVLKSEQCNYCQEGELIFSRCPSCGVVVIICGECGTVFKIQGGKKSKEVGDTSGATLCHACASSPHYKFPPATAEMIQNLGFTAGDYR